MSISLDASTIQAAIAEAEAPICDDLSRVFRKRAAAGGTDHGDWEQLHSIASLYPAFDLEDTPTPLLGLERLDDITDDRLKEWALLADAVGNNDLIARCNDVYWLRREQQKRVREDIDRARLAIGKYVAVARSLDLDEHSTPCFTRFQRALRLARTLNDTAQRNEAIDAIAQLVRARVASETKVGSLRLIRLLADEKIDFGAECADWCNTAADSCAAAGVNGDHSALDLAAEYRKLRITWLHKTAQTDKVPAEWLSIARYYRGVSNIFAKAGQKAHHYLGTAAHWMERHVEALRAAGASESDIAAAHRDLLSLQRESVKALRPVGGGVDATALAKAAIAAVEGQDYEQALFGLATCVARPTLDQVRELDARSPVLMRALGHIRVNQEGKQTAIREGIDAGDDNRWAALVETAQKIQLVLTEGGIAFARRTFNSAFPMRRESLEAMATGAAFVPHGREKTWARGLYAGFVGDWPLVAHLIPPQVEHALRRVFETNGVIASGLHRSRQHEHDLNKLLSMKEAAAVLGPELQLDLAASLAHGFGSNVRNYVAHGLYDDDHYHSFEVMYVWWQALRLVLVPQIMFGIPEDS